MAESYGRGSKKDYAHFLAIARGSVYETITQLNIAKRQHFAEDISSLEELAYEISRMLNTMIMRLNPCPSTLNPCPSTLNPHIMKIAVLMTCHNRKETTLRCLRGLLANRVEKEVEKVGGQWKVDVFLVDDGSTDGTGEAVKELFHPPYTYTSDLHLISGNGNLYWAKGMELAWKTCLQHEVEKVGGGGQWKYDGFLWLNDDVELYPDAIKKLATTVPLPLPTPTIFVGELENSRCEIVYGKRGDLFTGNFVYVPRAVCEKLGLICGDYAHAWADSDYAMRAKRAGVRVVSCGVVGKCEGHPNRPSLKGVGFRRRFRMLTDPKGWNVHDLWLYRKRNWGVCAAIASCTHLIAHVLLGERRV